MPPLANRTTFERSLSALPLVTYRAGETVIADGWRLMKLTIRAERPAMMKDDRLAVTPVLVKNLDAVLGRDCAHGFASNFGVLCC
jgi:hypothetical protein